MVRKIKEEIANLQNKISANNYLISNHPELKGDLELENTNFQKEIERLKSPKTATHFSIIGKTPIVPPGSEEDLGWNCMAIQQNGQQCSCKRVFGRFCKRHASHYIQEMKHDN